MGDFDDSETTSPLLLDGSLYSAGDNIPKKSEKGRNGSQDLEQDLTTFDDIKSVLSELLIKESSETNSGNIKSSRRPPWTRAPQTIYPSQITYGSAPISKKLLDNPGQPSLNPASPDTLSSLAHFVDTQIAQSHVHMVQTLRMFS